MANKIVASKTRDQHWYVFQLQLSDGVSCPQRVKAVSLAEAENELRDDKTVTSFRFDEELP
jgi:hypothetical protein